MPSQSDAGRRFQEKIRKALHGLFGQTFDMKVDISLTEGKSHYFDLASVDRTIFVECRLANWQSGAARVREAIDFLNALPQTATRFVAVPLEKHPARRETFAQYVIHSHESRLDKIGVLEFNEASGKLACIHGSLNRGTGGLKSNEVAEMCRHLDRILDWVEEFRNREDTRPDRVARLRSEGKIPKTIALQMHSVVQALSSGSQDPTDIRKAWAAIVEWAKTEGCRAAEVSTRL